MADFLYYLILVVMAAVVFVLIRGLVNMMQGGSGNLSNKLMQMRVLLQFVAVALIVIVLLITGGGR
ncbi:MAG: twin transmembrane helix small protein [Pseudomonadota bacterium]